MIYFLRHGQDDETHVGGWSNVSLIPEGIEEIKMSGLWIKDNLKIKKIICSDVKRAVESAEIIGSILDLPIEKNSKLREQNKGLLNGILKEVAYSDYPGYTDKEITVDTVFPEGESLRDLYNRIDDYLDEILSFEDDTLVVTHRGVINMIYFILNNKELDMNKKQFNVTTASIHELDKDNRVIKRIK